VIFGKAGGFGATIDLAAVAAGTGGFVIHGEQAFDQSGFSVASAGDVDGDGFSDLIVGARYADGPADGRDRAGDSYVLFGSATIGGSTSAVTQAGDAGDNVLIGNGAADVMVGGHGNDVLLGEGGADVFHGGEGDDVMTVSHPAFRLADGGGNFDTLALTGAGMTLDLGDRATAVKLQSIERIDLSASGNHTLAIDTLAVLGGIGAASGGRHVLTVLGGTGDSVVFAESAWRNTGSFTNGDGTFDRYAFGRAVVDVEQGVSVPGVTIEGTAGNDTVRYGVTVAGQPLPTNRSDIINGHGGNDVLDGRLGADTMAGGTGDDTFHVDDAGDVVTELAGEGIDTVRATISHALAAEVENLVLMGTAAIDGTGNELGNVLTGNAAANVLTGGGGDDILDGGAGNDTVGFGGAVNGATVDLAAGTSVGTGLGNDTLISIENAIGGGAADNLSGTDGDNRLDGGLGADRMVGRLGNDTYVVDNTGDVVVETRNQGTDTVETTLAAYVLGADVENLLYVGGGAFAGTGNTLANLLIGGAGNDDLNGGRGADTMRGGFGDDTYVVDHPGDIVDEAGGSGIDTVETTINYTLGADFENLALRGSAAISGTGNDLANVMTGNVGDNTLSGLGGDDALGGGMGADKLLGGDGNDVLNGGGWGVASDSDHLRGGLGDDTYFIHIYDVASEAGGGGIDTVKYTGGGPYTLGSGLENLIVTLYAGTFTGNSLDNTITASSNGGPDVLNGMRGNDTLSGRGGADTFVFNSGFGHDRITDFATEDTIRFEDGLFADFDDVMDHATQVGNSVVISYNAGNSVTISGYQLGNLAADDFLFA
jgi:Ca2+-binding RTX toxin-like protein